MYYTFTNPRYRDEFLKREKSKPVKRMKNRLIVQLTPSSMAQHNFLKERRSEKVSSIREEIIYVV